MTLKKLVAGYLSEGQHIDLHPLEEAATLAEWAIHDVKITLPIKPTQQQELDWLIEHGVDYVKQARQDWQKQYDNLMPLLDKVTSEWKVALQAWQDHYDLCHANGLNPDNFAGDARQTLIMPTEESK